MIQAAEARRDQYRRPGAGRRSPAARYSRFVGIAKLLLLAFAAGLIALLVVWSRINLDETRLRIGITEFAPEDIDSLNMMNPRFEGIDDKDRPFSITADRASQVDAQGRMIDLAEPRADITLTDGAWLALTAETGRYDRDAELLELSGSVSLFHDRGFELQTSRAQIDLKDGVAFGRAEVRGQGPAGELASEGFRVTDGGDSIFLTGRSRIVLYPSDEEAGE